MLRGVRAHSLSLVSLLMLQACEPFTPGAARVAITEGTPDPGDPGVVAIIDRRGTTIACTGTLLTASVVLTAAHCPVDEDSFRSYGALVGRAPGEGSVTPFVAARRHPSFDVDTFANDLTVAYLAEPVEAAPWPLLDRAFDSSFIGMEARVVGFGGINSSWEGGGEKREGTSQVASFDEQRFRVTPWPSQPCVGDSGGPVFLTLDGTEYLAGVVSSGDGACSEYSAAVRVDAFRDSFLADALAWAADGTAADGALCLSDAHCASGRCLTASDEPHVHYCSRACAEQRDCPDTMTCCETADDGRVCVYPSPSPAAIDAPCTRDADCVDAECREGVCVRRCVPNSDDCPDDYVCENASSINFFCRYAPSDGGCRTTGSSRTGGGWLVVVALLGAGGLGRRRRRARRDQA